MRHGTFLSARRLATHGRPGDGREAAVADYGLAHARPGDLDDVIEAMDWFAHHKSYLVNIGDEKGTLLDAAVRGANPRLALELGVHPPRQRRLPRRPAEIINRGWLHRGSIVVAKTMSNSPGHHSTAAYIQEKQGVDRHTIEYKAHVEYQTLIGDLVLELQALRLC
jgi:predicted O-methyltransferase YrrM